MTRPCNIYWIGRHHTALFHDDVINGNIFRVTGHLAGDFTGPRWIPRTEASGAELWFFFDLRLNKRLSKQSWVWWFETISHPLWLHGNVVGLLCIMIWHFTVYSIASHYLAFPSGLVRITIRHPIMYLSDSQYLAFLCCARCNIIHLSYI